jgi:cysteine synthase A
MLEAELNYATDITRIIGGTPLIRINKLSSGKNLILAKLEMLNPLSSVKDRIGLAMIKAAEQSGRIQKGDLIVEPTSGNTGIALAFVCAAKGYRLILTMPESMSEERRKILKRLGAKLVLTPAGEGMGGAIRNAREIAEKEQAFMPQQFENPANPEVHTRTTGPEIWKDTDGQVDIFIAGIGTGGTITGVGRCLKAQKDSIEVIGIEPEESPVMTGGNAGIHGIQGIGAGFIPKILDMEILDRILTVKTSDAMEMALRLTREEGLFVGISSGAAMAAASRIDEEVKGKIIVVVFPDTGERYLSVHLDSP